MAQIEKATFDGRDFTKIVNSDHLPHSWVCPHCGKKNRMDREAFECFAEVGKVMRHCERCMYVHMWEMVFTDEFKKEVIEALKSICQLDEEFNR